MTFYLYVLTCFQVSLLCALILPDMPIMAIAQDEFITSRATYTGSPECYSNPTGACGYGEYGRTVNNGIVTGVSRLYRNGSGCGACYQVKCTLPELCNDYGTTVIVTDYGQGDRTDFILNEQAFTRLAYPNTVSKLKSYGVVNIEYRRVSCGYPDSKLIIKIHENSHYPDYLALMILYNVGKYDVTGVDIWNEDYKMWMCMRRAYGAVWDLGNMVRSDVMLRVEVSDDDGVKKYVKPKIVIPSDWKAGAKYDVEV